MKINLVFDGNFLYHLSFSIFSTYYRGQDMCAVLEDREKRQVLIRKCVMNLCAAVRRFGDDVGRVIVVIDSHSWRRGVYDDYKYALTRVKEPWSDAFVEVLGEFEALLRKRGLIVSRVPGAEGDDLIMLWAYALDELPGEETVILTADSESNRPIRKVSKNQVVCARCHLTGLASGIDWTWQSSGESGAASARLI